MKQIVSNTKTWIAAIFSLGLAFLLPSVTSAGASIDGGDITGGGVGDFIGGVVDLINAILIPAILALAFLVFVYGVFKYFVAGGADDEAKEKGKSLMLYAIGGFVLILIFFGVVNLLASSIGLEQGGLNSIPSGVDVNN